MPLFKKDELAQLATASNLKRFRFVAHARAVKHFLAEALLSKSTFRKFFQYGTFIAIGFGVGSGFHFKEIISPSVPVASRAWVSDISVSLATVLGKSAQSEIIQLNHALESKFQQIKATDYPSLNSKLASQVNAKPGLKIGENNFAWLIENSTNHQTRFVFSRDQSDGSIEYFSIAINPQQYPHLVSAMDKAALKLEIE